jgi:excisionase family DNA binding protein
MESQQNEIVVLTSGQLKNLVSQIIAEFKNTAAPISEDEFLSSKEVQQFLKIGHSTLHRFINDGRLQPVRLGRKLLFKKSDLLK